MPMRARLLLAPLTALALVAGCSDPGSTDRVPGDPVTDGETTVLAGLLHRNHEAGGADVVVSAPYAEDALLRLTGEVDFRKAVGRGELETVYGDDRDPDVRSVVFTAEDVWFGDVAGLPEALAAAGAPPAGHLRRPLAAPDDGGEMPLVDVLLRLVLNLSSASADDPGAFRTGDYTWQGRNSINGELSTVYGLAGGETVAVAAADEWLVEYVAPLPGEDVDVTVTLSDHGRRTIAPPADDDTVAAADHPEIAARFGV